MTYNPLADLKELNQEDTTVKKGICLGCLPGESLEDKLRLGKEAGFDGVEPGTVDDLDEAKRIRKAADKAGLELPSIMGSKQWQYPLTSPDPKVRKASQDNVKQSIKCAKIWGSDTVLLVPGVVNEAVPYEVAYPNALKAIKQLAPIAEKAKVYLAVENVWNKFLLSPKEFKEFLDEVGSEYVQAYFDVGNILIYGYPEQWIRYLGSAIKKIHLKDFVVETRSFTWLFEGSLNWHEVSKALRDIGYQDYLTVELGPYRTAPDQFVFDMAVRTQRIIDGKV